MLKEKERQLFEWWQKEQGYTSFIRDGIFDESLWEEQPVKVTFILKEANWENGTIDLCQWLLEENKGSYWKTWNNIARWSKALLDGGEYPRCVSEADKSYWLSRVSFINLKKVGGGRQANNALLREFAGQDARFIREQLSLYAPDIIICCGRWIVADILRQNVLLRQPLSGWQKTRGGSDFFYVQLNEKETPVPVVSFYHPQRIANHAVFEDWYESMRETGKELLSKKQPQEPITLLPPAAAHRSR